MTVGGGLAEGALLRLGCNMTPGFYLDCKINKSMSVFHASVLLINHELRHIIVKLAVDPRGPLARCRINSCDCLSAY